MNRLLTAMGLIAMASGACALTKQAALPAPPPQPEVIDPDAQSTDSGFLLSPAEVKALQLRAENGDPNAAFRLSLHFMSAGDRESERHWQSTAARNGHAVAQYNLWVELKDRNDCASKLEALAWLESAANAGEETALGELEGYSKQAHVCSAQPLKANPAVPDSRHLPGQ